MRFLKCYLANNANNRFVNATEACRTPDDHWTCTRCGCTLTLHTGSQYEKAWFEHDKYSISMIKLRTCPYFDPEEKENEAIKKLRERVKPGVVPSPPKTWHCVWCQKTYTSNKICPSCKTGIYSITLDEYLKNISISIDIE